MCKNFPLAEIGRATTRYLTLLDANDKYIEKNQRAIMTKYLIDFINTATDTQISEYLDYIGGAVIKEYDAFDKLYLVDSPGEPVITDIVESAIPDEGNPIQLLGTTIYMDQNHGKIVTDGSLPAITLDTSLEQNWWKMYSFSDPDLDAPQYVTNRRGQGSVIYLVDSGISIEHEEFSESSVSNLFSFTEDFDDLNGHGTALASVMVGKTCGVTNAEVKSVKIFEQGKPTMLSDLMNAFDAIYHDCIQDLTKRHIVNLSWSMAKNTFVENKIRQLMLYDIFVVCSAGNSGEAIGDVTPASMPEVLTIGSYNSTLTPSDFTNYTGSAISCTQGCTNTGALDGFAPGERIWAALPIGGYNFVAGTSLSAAIQSAAIAYNMDARKLFYPPRFYDTDQYSFHRNVGLSPRVSGGGGLLDLSDPRYAQSANLMTTFKDEIPENANSTVKAFHGSFRIPAGNSRNLTFIHPHLVKKIQFDNDLPEFVLVESSGKIRIDPPDFTEEVLKLSMPLTITYNDDSEEHHDFDVYIIRADLTVDTVQDEEVKLIPESNCDFSCLDDCTGGLVCLFFGKFTCFCGTG
jgi:hypothetical protein